MNAVRITPAQQRVLAEIQLGYSPNAIAGRLFLSVKTVRRHIEDMACKIDPTGKPLATVRSFAMQHTVSVPANDTTRAA